MNVQSELVKSLYTGFVDQQGLSLEEYRPRLLVNNNKIGQKVLTSIIKELKVCDEFFFSVAFITYSGVISLLSTLEELRENGIKGKIVASQYLNFTDPKALLKLLEFDNIELKMVTDQDLHSKGYIFRKGKVYSLIVGSSNLTQAALSANKEWNIKVSSMEKGSLITETLQEFQNTFKQGIGIDEQWIDQYKKIYQFSQSRNISIDERTDGNAADHSRQKTVEAYNQRAQGIPKVVPNKMQVKALVGIEKIRESGENKALLVSATGTGKTYLSAFDVRKVNPSRVLFLAHREQILNQSIESFKEVIGYEVSYGKVTGGAKGKDYYASYIFSTVQTMSKDKNLERYERDSFDYIIIDGEDIIGLI